MSVGVEGRRSDMKGTLSSVWKEDVCELDFSVARLGDVFSDVTLHLHFFLYFAGPDTFREGHTHPLPLSQ